MAKPTLPTVHAANIARLHTYFALAAFLSALVLGCLLHFEKIVKNGVAEWPDEWFPSVSATIGDWYPERNVFQILIALTSGPRFALVFLQYYLQNAHYPSAFLPTCILITGIVRTFACGGWVYVPSYEAHNFHDFAMIAYIVCNIPWMWGGVSCSVDKQARKLRTIIASAFFGSLVPLIYFFLQHKVHRIPGAYTHYAFFEWSLIFLDVFYDAVSEIEFKATDFQIAVGQSLEKGVVAGKGGANEIASSSSGDLARDVHVRVNSEEAATREAAAVQESKSNTYTALASIVSDLLKPSERHAFLTFFADVYLSFIFWTLLTVLAPSFFYFSVWELGVAGHELTLLTTLSPASLLSEPARAWASTRNGRTTLWAGALIGISSYVMWSPLGRMFCVGLATASIMMGKAVDWINPESAGYEGLLLGLGLILSSLSKHANHTNNPVWPMVTASSGGYNKTGIILFLLALYEFHTRPTLQPVVPIPSAPTPGKQTVAAKKSKSEKKTSTSSSVENAQKLPQTRAPITKKDWLPPALALGSLIFTLHQLLADSSTLIAWSWTGYPIKGPVPNLHGSMTLLTQGAGLFIPLLLGDASPILANPIWLSFGAGAAFIMYSYENWAGYAGGLAFAVFLMSIIPIVLQRAVGTTGRDLGAAGKVFCATWAVKSVFDFLNTLTVAYAFVPGGVIFRERTDLILVAQILCLAPAFHWPRSQLRSIAISLPSPSTGFYIRTFLAVVSILSVAATIYRLPVDSPRPHKPGPRIINAGIWTVHFGIDDEGRDSQRRMRDLIKDMELDIVGLLETDLHRVTYGNRDLTRVISEELGYHVDLGPGPNKHTWGAVLLSKFPIINSTHHLLPSPHGELAPAIEAVLDIYGIEVTVIVAHNGQEEDPLDRELQSTELARIMAKSYPQPVIFLGYVVTEPKAERPAPYEIMVTDGKVHDIDRDDWDRWCEYIFYRGLYRTSYVRVSRSTITDTELQIGQFVLPRYGYPVTDDSVGARYIRSRKETLPEDHWFPMEYYGNEDEGGVRGHYYHVFMTPLYYQLPDGAIV